MDLQTLALTFLFLKVKLINFHLLHICVIYTAFWNKGCRNLSTQCFMGMYLITNLLELNLYFLQVSLSVNLSRICTLRSILCHSFYISVQTEVNVSRSDPTNST